MSRFLGFLIVRRPDQNFDLEGRGCYPKYARSVQGTYYAGVQRLAWFDIEEIYRFGIGDAKESSVAAVYNREVREKNWDFSGIHLCSDLSICVELFNALGEFRSRNEILAVRSTELESFKSWNESETNCKTEFLGHDPILLGWGSLIYRTVFWYQKHFSRFNKYFNQNGLLDVGGVCVNELIEEYAKLSEKGMVEEITTMQYGVACVEVFRVVLGNG